MIVYAGNFNIIDCGIEALYEKQINVFYDTETGKIFSGNADDSIKTFDNLENAKIRLIIASGKCTEGADLALKIGSGNVIAVGRNNSTFNVKYDIKVLYYSRVEGTVHDGITFEIRFKDSLEGCHVGNNCIDVIDNDDRGIELCVSETFALSCFYHHDILDFALKYMSIKFRRNSIDYIVYIFENFRWLDKISEFM